MNNKRKQAKQSKKGKYELLVLGRILKSIILVVLTVITVLAVQNKDSLLSLFGNELIGSKPTASTDTNAGLRKCFTRNSNDML